MLGLDRIPGNAILWTAGVSVTNGDDAAVALVHAEVSNMMVKLREVAENEAGGVDWVYLNYADVSQDSLGSYGEENVGFMREVAGKYDPEGWWQRMVPGGFKLERVTG